jgi:hypothetical protein
VFCDARGALKMSAVVACARHAAEEAAHDSIRRTAPLQNREPARRRDMARECQGRRTFATSETAMMVSVVSNPSGGSAE